VYTHPIRNNARVHVLAAFDAFVEAVPFAVTGIDCDNGSEFINHHLAAWCAEEEITLTRSRPLNKNDGCFVEQKNWSVVRREVGYGRYDTQAERELIAQVMAACDNVQVKAAARLGINRNTLHKKLEEYGLEK